MRRFTIEGEKLAEIAIGWSAEVVSRHLLEPDWSPAGEHQTWIDAAPVAEIVSWLEDLGETP